MLSADDFAQRAYLHALNPRANPAKLHMDRHASVSETPPMLGLFNDIPHAKIRQDDVAALAAAGFAVASAAGAGAGCCCCVRCFFMCFRSSFATAAWPFFSAI